MVDLNGKPVDILGHHPAVGSYKSRLEEHMDKEYGDGNWDFAWVWMNGLVEKEFAIKLYEDAYFEDSESEKHPHRPKYWKKLREVAKDVWDNAKSNVDSRRDYSIQEAYSTHLQDISIRRVFLRRGWKFEGDELIQIRGNSKYESGRMLSPGWVPFQLPHLIIDIEADLGIPKFDPLEISHKRKIWWQKDTAEDFYQKNRVVVRKVA